MRSICICAERANRKAFSKGELSPYYQNPSFQKSGRLRGGLSCSAKSSAKKRTKSSFVRLQFYQNNLRPVVEAKRENAVAYAAADKHFRFSLGKQSRVIFRKQSLIRSRQTAYKRQAELTAVRMALRTRSALQVI